MVQLGPSVFQSYFEHCIIYSMAVTFLDKGAQQKSKLDICHHDFLLIVNLSVYSSSVHYLCIVFLDKSSAACHI